MSPIQARTWKKWWKEKWRGPGSHILPLIQNVYTPYKLDDKDINIIKIYKRILNIIYNNLKVHKKKFIKKKIWILFPTSKILNSGNLSRWLKIIWTWWILILLSFFFFLEKRSANLKWEERNMNLLVAQSLYSFLLLYYFKGKKDKYIPNVNILRYIFCLLEFLSSNNRWSFAPSTNGTLFVCTWCNPKPLFDWPILLTQILRTRPWTNKLSDLG